MDDAAWASLELDGGAIASVEVSRMATGAKQPRIELFGADGALRFDLEEPERALVPRRHRPDRRAGLHPDPGHRARAPLPRSLVAQGHVLGWENAFTNQARDLLLAIHDRDQPRFSPDFAEGLALQRVLDAIIASDAADGTTVTL